MSSRKKIIPFLAMSLAVAIGVIFFYSMICLAAGATIDDSLKGLGDAVAKTPKLPQSANGTELDVPSFIGYLLKRLLEITGAVFLAYLLYGGFLWMFSQGESKKIETAKNVIFWAITGLVIILSSYALTSFALKIVAQ
jgi:hypothetical protein